MKKYLIAGALALSAPANAAVVDTTSVSVSFDECIARRELVIAKLNVNPRDIVPIVNTGILTMTRVCTSDGSVLVSCSKPDSKMVITQSTNGCN